MDFLDPRKQHAHMVRLVVGYVLVAIAVLFATLVLLYQAYGFGLGKDGKVIQSGFVFMSSQPAGAKIELNGKPYKSATNTKLQLPEGQYDVRLQRDGYRDWHRLITVAGGSVQHFDYPKLFPVKLTSTAVRNYPAAPGLATESPDRRWLVVQSGTSLTTFDQYDLSDPKKMTASVTALTLPDGLLTLPKSGPESWTLEEWSTDNRHILLQHLYGAEGTAAGSEYIMLDRQDPTQSVNLTRTLSLAAGRQLVLRDKKFDQYYVFDPAARTLESTTIADAGKTVPVLDQVLAFKPYGADKVLYVTDKDAPAGKVLSMLKDGDNIYKLREDAAAPPYLIDMAQYSNTWYVAVGSSGDNHVYVYANPQRLRAASATAALAPTWVLKVNAPSFLAFSSNTQFVLAESGASFADFDAENDRGYSYTSSLPVDAPAVHVAWMDGDRLAFVSGGKLTVLDYDNTNVQTLVAASPRYQPFFNRDYTYAYTLAPAAGNALGGAASASAAGLTLMSTPLLTAADQ